MEELLKKKQMEEEQQLRKKKEVEEEKQRQQKEEEKKLAKKKKSCQQRKKTLEERPISDSADNSDSNFNDILIASKPKVLSQSRKNDDKSDNERNMERSRMTIISLEGEIKHLSKKQV